jgi:hypothetical protein
VEVPEEETIFLECELSKKGKQVKWLKDGVEIVPGGRIEIVYDRFSHQLIIEDATLDDIGQYSCVCGDVSTSCNVKVEGMSMFIERERGEREREKKLILDDKSIFIGVVRTGFFFFHGVWRRMKQGTWPSGQSGALAGQRSQVQALAGAVIQLFVLTCC